MKQIANDEIKNDPALLKHRTPTMHLRFRDVGRGRMLLEQLWSSPFDGIDEIWIPVSMVVDERS